MLVDRRQTRHRNGGPKTCVLNRATLTIRTGSFPRAPKLIVGTLLGGAKGALRRVSLFRVGRTFTTITLADKGVTNLSRRGIGIGNNTITLKRPVNTDKTEVVLALVRRLGHHKNKVNVSTVYDNKNRKSTIVVRIPGRWSILKQQYDPTGQRARLVVSTTVEVLQPGWSVCQPRKAVGICVGVLATGVHCLPTGFVGVPTRGRSLPTRSVRVRTGTRSQEVRV